MTLELPVQITRNQYTADGVLTSYPYDYKLYNANTTVNDIKVYQTPAGQVPNEANDLLTINTDYTVTNVDVVTGGNINFVVLPPAGDTLTFKRQVAAQIETDFGDPRNINGNNLDLQFQKIVAMIQQLDTQNEQLNLHFGDNALVSSTSTLSEIQPLLNENEIWKRQGDNIIATVLDESGNCSTLRSDLANAAEGSDGARLVGIYDTVNLESTTVQALLANLNENSIKAAWPINSIFFAADDNLVPPGQGIGGIVWTEQTAAEGHIVMGKSSSGDWQVATGATAGTISITDGHAITVAQMADHKHQEGSPHDNNTEVMWGDVIGTTGKGNQETGASDYNDYSYTSSIGNGEAHTHTLTELKRVGYKIWKRTA